MKITLSTNAAANMLWADKDANWSYRGARALVEYLEQWEEDLGEELEFDVVALRCDFCEYDSSVEAAKEYGYEPDLDENKEDLEDPAADWLCERTTVIEFDGGIIIQRF
jgi:hypothetical protein